MMKHWAVWTAVTLGMAMPAVAMGDDRIPAAAYSASSYVNVERQLAKAVQFVASNGKKAGHSNRYSGQGGCLFNEYEKKLDTGSASQAFRGVKPSNIRSAE